MIIDTILGLLLVLSAFTDIKSHKIYNWTTFPGVILGLGFNTISAGWPGLKESFLGLLVGFGIFFLFYLAGLIGGGDVKLIAAIGALKGKSFVIQGGLYSLLFGGIIAIIVMIYRKTLKDGLRYVFLAFVSLFIYRTKPVPLERKESTLLPYAFFIVLGMVYHWIELRYPVPRLNVLVNVW